jgi:hypothetical protein
VSFSNGPHQEFMELDTCGVTERNGTSISADFTDDAIEND